MLPGCQSRRLGRCRRRTPQIPKPGWPVCRRHHAQVRCALDTEPVHPHRLLGRLLHGQRLFLPLFHRTRPRRGIRVPPLSRPSARSIRPTRYLRRSQRMVQRQCRTLRLFPTGRPQMGRLRARPTRYPALPRPPRRPHPVYGRTLPGIPKPGGDTHRLHHPQRRIPGRAHLGQSRNPPLLPPGNRRATRMGRRDQPARLRYKMRLGRHHRLAVLYGRTRPLRQRARRPLPQRMDQVPRYPQRY